MTGEEKKEATKPRREEPAKYSGYQEADQGAGSPTNLVSTVNNIEDLYLGHISI